MMNRNALKMVTLAALSSMSVAAMAVTAVRPTLEAPVIARPTLTVKPGAVAAPKAVLPGTQLKDAPEAAQAAGQACDPKAMYAALTADTGVLPEEAQGLVNDNIIQIAGNSCGHEAGSMSATARTVLLKTGLCAKTKGIASVTDANERKTILGMCQAGEKRALGMMDATDAAEMTNVEKIANDCHYYKLAM